MFSQYFSESLATCSSSVIFASRSLLRLTSDSQSADEEQCLFLGAGGSMKGALVESYSSKSQPEREAQRQNLGLLSKCKYFVICLPQTRSFRWHTNCRANAADALLIDAQEAVLFTSISLSLSENGKRQFLEVLTWRMYLHVSGLLVCCHCDLNVVKVVGVLKS